MRVLLISPLPRIDPACGDVVYSQSLLKNPPKGVRYVTYVDALADGSLIERVGKKGLITQPVASIFSKIINVLRARKILFWEPFRHFTVLHGVYDLIHIHVFSAHFQNLNCPLVVSNAAPLGCLYRDARHYAGWYVGFMEAADRILGLICEVNVVSYSLPQVTRVIAFTEYLRDWYVSRGIVSSSCVDIVPIYLEAPPQNQLRLERRLQPRRIGFVARDFRAKGGFVLLKAFALVRVRRPDAELIIVGSQPQLSDNEMASGGIQWIHYVPRQELLSDLMPSFDVFAYPTEFDGMPLVVLEALSHGIPVVTSDYQAMPELVDRGRAGRVSRIGGVEELAENILVLLNPDENARARAASLAWFRKAFSAEAVRPRLLESYKRAVEDFSSTNAVTTHA